MPSLKSLSHHLNTLSVNTTSKHPTLEDSVNISTTDFDEVSTSPTRHAVRSEQPLISNITVKHGSAFNSERDSGMSKLQQLQFVEALKRMIIDEAALTYPSSKDLVVSISRKSKTSHAFCSAAVHVATLLARTPGNADRARSVLGQGKECEYLADAVESLWERVLVGNGERSGELRVEYGFGKEVGEEGETIVASER